MGTGQGDPNARRISAAIFDLAPIGIEIYDGQGRLLDVNKKCLDLFGLESIDAVRGFDLFEDPNISPDNLAALRRGQAVSYEAVFDFDLVAARALYPTHKRGQMYLGVHVEPVREPDAPSPSNFIVLIQDITTRKTAEEELRKEKELFSLLMDNAPLYVFFKDHELRALRVSKSFEGMLGMPIEQAVGKSMDELFPPELARSMVEADRDVLDHGKTVRVQEELAGRFYETVKFPVPGDDGRPKLAGFSMDITERRSAERQLSDLTERLALATSAGRLGIWDWNLVTNEMLWDDRMLELYGITREAFTGTVDSWTKGVHPDDKQRALDDRNKALAGKKEYHTEFRVSRPNGEVAWIKAHGSVIRDKSGKAVRMIGINVDVTGSKLVEDELRRAQNLEALGLLAGGIAHDFNNLLHGIFAYVELAKEDTREAETARCLGKTLATLDRARALTRQLITFAKGGAPIRVVAPLGPAIHETVSFALSGSNSSCRFDIAADLLPCNYDRNQIAQVIENIVINAQQSMPKGGQVEVVATNIELGDQDHPPLPPGPYVRISIRDEGVGMSREELARVFHPFYTTKSKGHGLGLTTSYSIIHRHGGCIDAESTPGRGSTFHIYLPATPGAPVAVPAESVEPHRGSGLFVVMDDELVVRDTIGRMLTTFGYEVAAVANGSQAFDYLQTRLAAGHAVAAMILDLTVPGEMGGEEAIAPIRRLAPSLPVFVASGYADDPVMANPQGYGFTASISKPFGKTDLARILNLHMNDRC
jgi:PAS domain S-box-containing protein